MEVNNHYIQRANPPSYTTENAPKSRVAQDYRSQIVQNQESRSSCCLSSCLIKIKNLLIALFSCLFCCKSESSEETIKHSLRTIVADLKSRRVVDPINNAGYPLERIHFKLLTKKDEEARTFLKELPPYFQALPLTSQIFEQEWQACFKWRTLICLADKVTRKPFDMEDFMFDVRYFFSSRQFDIIESLPNECPDETKTQFEKVLIGLYFWLSSEDFNQFLTKFSY